MPTKGTVRILALLIAFSDYPETNTSDSIRIKLFGSGAGGFPYESLHNFYARSSYNQLDIQGNVLGWYHAPYPRSSVIQTNAGRDNVIKEALNFYVAQGQDFSQYDNDGDGTIDYLVVVWTGPDTGWANFWWGYMTKFQDATYLLSGKKLNTYSWQWESNPFPGSFDPRVVIHETGHALGLPDLYDYTIDVGDPGGVGGLDMMDDNWGDHNCFSKFLLEWIVPTTYATGSGTVTLRSSASNPDAVVIMPGITPGNPFDEFFMVQNRYHEGNDATYPNDGLLIWHINGKLSSDGITYYYNNSNTSPKLVRLMEADGLEQISMRGPADAGDYYVAGKEFTPTSLPNSNRSDGSMTKISIDAISASGPTMSFNANIIPCPAILVSPSSLPGGTLGVGYSQTVTATGGIDPYTFKFLPGSNSPFSISTSGLLSGTPYLAGAFNFTVVALDAWQCSGSQAYTVNVGGSPVASTQLTSNLTDTSATLNATVKSNGLPTTYYFEWGLSKSYGNRTSSESLASGFSNEAVVASLGGLSRGLNYHYRIVAGNTAGTTYGMDESFILGTPRCNSFTFGLPTSYTVGTSPGFIATGDFNGDTKLDMAVANIGSNNISILLGNGDGTFSPAFNLPVNGAPSSVLAGDFNGDGNLDLAVTLKDLNEISILLGNGNGTFGAPVRYGVGTLPSNIIVGDFNGDGKMDLAAAVQSGGPVSVLLGNGDGTFQAAQSYGGTGLSPTSLATADLNGDGYLDLVIISSTGSALTTLLGRGDGTFQSGWSCPFCGTVTEQVVTVGEFNGDRILDLITMYPGSRTITPLLGKGDGSFLFPSGPYPSTGNEPRSVAVGDFNGDARADLAVADAGSNDVSILMGRGDGTFAATVYFGANVRPGFIAVGDFNGDDNPDLVVTNPTDGTVSVLFNGCGGSCTPIAVSPSQPKLTDGITGKVYDQIFTATGGIGPYQFTVSDGNLPPGLSLSSDGHLIGTPISLGTFGFNIVVRDANNCPASRTFTILINGPPSITTEPATFVTSNSAWLNGTVVENGLRATISFQWGITNGYGNTIVATNSSYKGHIYITLSSLSPGTTYHYRIIATSDAGTTYGNDLTFSTLQVGPCPSPNFTTPIGAGVNGGYSFAAGDFNGDGKSDLASISYGDYHIQVQLGNGDGSFPYPTDYSGLINYPTYIATGDINGDGKVDLVAGNSQEIIVFIGTGDGRFNTIRKSQIGFGPYGTSVATGDFNGDGKLDLVSRNDSSNTVKIALGDGTGLFTLGGSFSVGGNPAYVAVGDFNDDGILDLITANKGSKDLSILIGKGDGTFQPAISIPIGTIPYSIVVKDLDANGELDLAVASYSSDNVSIFLGHGDGTFQAPVDYPVGLNPASITSGDFNADGKVDLAVVNASSNDVAVLVGNGNGTFQAPYFFGAGPAPNLVVATDFNGDGRMDLAVYNSFSSSNSILLNLCGSSCPVLSISPNSLPDARVGSSYNQSLVANGGSAPYGYTLDTYSGLPAGLTLDVTGVISGTPTRVMFEWFSVIVKDVNQCPAGRTYSLIVGGVPSVTTQNPTDVTSNSAKLKGNVNSNYLPTTGYFQWGINTNYVNETAPQSIDAGSRIDTYANLGALQPNTTYHYRAVGSNDAGTSYGLDNTFTTGAGECSTASFKYAPTLNLNFGPYTFAAGDFNGDGKADLAILRDTGLQTYLGNGDGTFLEPLLSPLSSKSQRRVVGDFNADGRSDIALLEPLSDEVLILLANADGTFQAPLHYPVGDFPNSIAVGDFNSDGYLDLVVANMTSSSLSILMGKGDGSFVSPRTFSVASALSVVGLGDFNGDGKQDLATMSSYNPGTVFFGAGDGTFQNPVSFAPSPDVYAVAAGDFNGDGKADLALGSYGSVAIMLSNGDGTFQPPVLFGVPNTPFDLVVGDFNSDGRLDVAVANYSSNDISILLGKGDGTLQASINYGVDNRPYYLAMADFDNDGRPDLATLNQISYSVSVLLNARSTCPVIAISPDILPDASYGQPYMQSLDASGGRPPYGFAVTGGILPSSLTLSSIGTISGTPNFTVYSIFTVTATDADGLTRSKTYTLKITGLPQPTAVTTAATAVGAITATVNGTVNPKGVATTAYFQWGVPASYGNRTPDQPVGNGTSDVNIAANLGSLLPNTTYHYRVVAASNGGTTNGSDETFGTTACPTVVMNPTSQSFSALGGNGSVNVTAACNWTAVSSDPWIIIPSGATGSGNGTINYTVDSHSNPTSRGGIITIGTTSLTVLQGAQFADVPAGYMFYEQIGKLSARGVTTGCGGGNYCPDASVTREQMAIFIEHALGVMTAPPATQQTFEDVSTTAFSYPFIEDFAARGITAGCSMTPRLYCPTSTVTREQMAIFIERALGVVTPPTPTQQTFVDVPTTWFSYPFIEDFLTRGITAGCSVTPKMYCPASPVTRGQMAVFLVKAFGL
ncbi:MAG: FG-GAP-like repeat-containing protein [Acidobacteriia bacterium]|nr:FG-GAP-like repeat-containing protein [Terriglobia bacterium]